MRRRRGVVGEGLDEMRMQKTCFLPPSNNIPEVGKAGPVSLGGVWRRRWSRAICGKPPWVVVNWGCVDEEERQQGPW